MYVLIVLLLWLVAFVCGVMNRLILVDGCIV